MVYRCPACRLEWHHKVSTCVKCGGPLSPTSADQVRVLLATKVEVPSVAHEEVPYYCLLVEDAEGRHSMRKSREPRAPGDVLREGGPEAALAVTLGLVGTGVMGGGIARAALEAGWALIWRSRSRRALEKARTRVREGLLKQMAEARVDRLLEAVVWTEEAAPLAGADIIIESVIEDLPTKRQLFLELAALCPPETILASNSSSLSVATLAEGLAAPQRVVGMHFFNPVSRMRLVEVVRGPATSAETVSSVCELAKALGKVPVVVRDSPGFVVNRILMPYLNEAVRVVEEGTATIADVDAAAQLGLNHPIGPLALIDLIGVDVFVSIMDVLVAQFGEKRFEAASMARQLVEQGRLGRKTGKGFYEL
jgi:3-hydroxybutyryl-CoA dehydrogenase